MSQTLEQSAPRPLPDDYWDGELVPHTDPRAAVVSINPDRMSGTPCFVGSRVPIQHLWDHLDGSSIEEFLEGFEGVSKAQVQEVLRLALQKLLEGLPTISARSFHESGLTAIQFQRLLANGIASVNPNIVSGAVVFAGTRVPIYNLRDYLSGGDSIEDFLESFPTVRQEQAQQTLGILKGSPANGRLSAREHPLR